MPGISVSVCYLEISLLLETFIMQTINYQKEYDGIDLVVHLQIMSVGQFVTLRFQMLIDSIIASSHK